MKLSPMSHNWLTAPANRAIINALGADSVRYVGGCVRNALLERPVADTDMATVHTPERVVSLLKSAGIRTVPTGLSHGTVTAIIGKEPIEITTLRTDDVTDGRHAKVSYTQSWELDAHRRDFTINALYADTDGHVYDPTEQGLDDIKAARLRFVGKATARVTEDYLRILRYFRFLAWYGGDTTLDKEALTACREHREGLKGLSAERVWSELKKLLSAPNPGRALRIMLTHEVLETLMPEASNVEGLEAFIKLEQRESLKPDPLLRLMAMSARDGMAMMLLTTRMKMSNAEKARLRGWADDGTTFEPNMTERDMLAAIYTAGQRRAMDRCLIRAAGEPDALLSARWMTLVNLASGWTPPEFPITGQDLIDAGITPGLAMGKRMSALKALWVKSGFTATKPKLLMALKLMGG